MEAMSVLVLHGAPNIRILDQYLTPIFMFEI